MNTFKYNDKEIPIVILPKGTLLFRLVKNPENDLRGYPIENGKRCISPYIHVYFYPNPFVGEIIFNKYMHEFNENIYVYILTRDIKILQYISPSKYIRKGTLPTCEKIKQGCLPLEFKNYNTCFTQEVIEKYPDVVGYIGMSRQDSSDLMENIKNEKYKQFIKYMHYTKDARGIIGIPEVAIYPLKKRLADDLIVTPSKKLVNNYKLLKVFNRNDRLEIIKFMDTQTKFNNNTHYFEYVKK